jgi:predicted transcriptional regulator
MEQLHHGLIVEKVVRRSGMSLSHLARLLNVNRRSIYNWFNQQRLSIDLILSIEKAIGYDFSNEIPEYSKYRVSIMKPVEDNQSEVWKMKYVDLLEKYNELLISHRHLTLEDVA